MDSQADGMQASSGSRRQSSAKKREPLMPATSAAPTGKSSAIVEIERIGFKYTEVAQYDLTNLSPDHRVQVRDARNYARKEDVERYAVQMELSEFPPIVITSDGWIVDGNTRVGAAIRRKQNRFPAIVLDLSFDGASAQKQGELHALAATLNALNGQPLTKAETRKAIKHFLELGWTIQQTGRAIGTKPSVISGVKREIDAQEKLKRVGMQGNGELKGASLRALGGPLVLTLNDAPYQKLALLAADAGLNSGEIFAAAKEVKETGSDSAGIARIQQLRTENEERIHQRSLTGVAKPPLARQLRQHLGFVLKFANQEAQLVENNPPVIQQHIETLEKSIAILQGALQLQRSR